MNNKIHPTAIIDSSAQIDENVSINPYAIVGKNVSIGKGSVIKSHAHIVANTKIGEQNVIGSGAVIGDLAQDLTINQLNDTDDDTWLEIGDSNTFFPHTLISRGTNKGNGSTIIGSNNMFLGKSHIGHDVVVKDHCVISHAAMVGGHAEIGSHAHIGGATAVHQSCRIGAYAMVGAMIFLKKDVLPFFLVAGNPVMHYKLNTVGLRRQNFSAERLQILKQAQKIFRNNIQHSLESLPQNEDIVRLIEWRKRSLRGIYFFINSKVSKKNND